MSSIMMFKFKSFLYTLVRSFFSSDMLLTNIFLQSVACLSFSLTSCLTEQNLQILLKHNLSIYSFIYHSYGVFPKLYKSEDCVFSPVFSSRSFIVLCLLFNYNLYWVNVCIRYKVSLEGICIWISDFFIYGKYFHFFIELLLHLCQKSIDYIGVHLFLGSLFSSIDLCVYGFPNSKVLISINLQ